MPTLPVRPPAPPDSEKPEEITDIGEYWRVRGQIDKERRADKRHNADKLLSAAGLKFDFNNGGAHLIVHAPDGRIIDYWPGTSKWTVRGTSQIHRGGAKTIIQMCKATLPFPEPEDLPPTPSSDGLR